MKILVTGGAGYIGSHTCKILNELGHEPVVYDNLSTGHEWAVKWGPLVVGDIADEELIMSTIKRYSISAIIHFAAHAYVGESVENPRKYFQNNVIGSMNLIHAMMDAGVNNIVFSSSCAVYGVPDKVPISEKHPRHPINPYGESKLFIENVLEWYGRVNNLNWVTLRYFNAAGADHNGEVGEKHNPETHLIPLAICSAFKQRSFLEIYGTNYPTKDGTAIRDYVHVADLANAHVLALNYLFSGGESLALNLGNGKGYSIYEVIKAVEKVSNKKIRVRKSDRRPGDPHTLIAAANLAEKKIGWIPKYTKLLDIIKTAWNWHTKKVK